MYINVDGMLGYGKELESKKQICEIKPVEVGLVETKLNKEIVRRRVFRERYITTGKVRAVRGREGLALLVREDNLFPVVM